MVYFPQFPFFLGRFITSLLRRLIDKATSKGIDLTTAKSKEIVRKYPFGEKYLKQKVTELTTEEFVEMQMDILQHILREELPDWGETDIQEIIQGVMEDALRELSQDDQLAIINQKIKELEEFISLNYLESEALVEIMQLLQRMQRDDEFRKQLLRSYSDILKMQKVDLLEAIETLVDRDLVSRLDRAIRTTEELRNELARPEFHNEKEVFENLVTYITYFIMAPEIPSTPILVLRGSIASEYSRIGFMLEGLSLEVGKIEEKIFDFSTKKYSVVVIRRSFHVLRERQREAQLLSVLVFERSDREIARRVAFKLETNLFEGRLSKYIQKFMNSREMKILMDKYMPSEHQSKIIAAMGTLLTGGVKQADLRLDITTHQITEEFELKDWLEPTDKKRLQEIYSEFVKPRIKVLDDLGRFGTLTQGESLSSGIIALLEDIIRIFHGKTEWRLTSKETFLLLLAIWIHNLGLGYRSEEFSHLSQEEKIARLQQESHQRSVELVNNEWQLLEMFGVVEEEYKPLCSLIQGSMLGMATDGHPTLSQTSETWIISKGERVKLRLLMALFRLAKICDMSHERYQKVARDFIGMSDDSKIGYVLKGRPIVSFDKHDKSITINVYVQDSRHEDMINKYICYPIWEVLVTSRNILKNYGINLEKIRVITPNWGEWIYPKKFLNERLRILHFPKEELNEFESVLEWYIHQRFEETNEIQQGLESYRQNVKMSLIKLKNSQFSIKELIRLLEEPLTDSSIENKDKIVLGEIGKLILSGELPTEELSVSKKN